MVSTEQKTGTAEPSPTKLHPKKYQEECPRLNSTSKQEKPPLHSKAATGRPVTPMENLLLTPEVVWQQSSKKSVRTSQLVKIIDDPTNETTLNTHTPDSEKKTDVESDILPLNGTSLQHSISNTELVREKDTESKPVPCPNNSENTQLETQETSNDYSSQKTNSTDRR